MVQLIATAQYLERSISEQSWVRGFSLPPTGAVEDIEEMSLSPEVVRSSINSANNAKIIYGIIYDLGQGSAHLKSQRVSRLGFEGHMFFALIVL